MRHGSDNRRVTRERAHYRTHPRSSRRPRWHPPRPRAHCLRERGAKADGIECDVGTPRARVTAQRRDVCNGATARRARRPV